MAQLRFIYIISFLLLLNSCNSKLKFLVAKSLTVLEEYAVLVGGEIELKPTGGIEPYTLSILPVSCNAILSVADKKSQCGEVVREQIKPGVFKYIFKAPPVANEIYISLTDNVSIKEPIILLVHVVKPVEIEPKLKSMIIGRSININGLYGLKPYTYKITAGSENGELKEIPGSTAVELKAKGLGTMKITVQDKMGNTADASIEVKDELKIYAPPLMVQTSGVINVTAEGGIPPYTFSATGGTLQVISNVATATQPASAKITAPNSPTSIPVKVVDSEGNEKSLNISVYAPIAISPTSLMIAKNGNFQFTASGGVAPYVFTTTCGTGSQIDANGNFKAPPTSSGANCQVSVSFSLTGGSITGTATSTVKVTENFTMSVSSVEMMVGNSYDLSSVMNGGAAPYKCTADNISGKGTLSQKAGSANTSCLFTASSAGDATVKITDSSTTPMSVIVPIKIYSALTITPGIRKIAVNNSLNFSTTGGVGTKILKVKSGSGTVTDMTFAAGSNPGTVVIEASDAFNPPNKVTATITVNPALSIAPQASYVLSGQTKQFTASGGDEVYTYSLDSSTFATIDAATGLLTAKSTTNPVDVLVRVKDGMNNQVSTMLNIVPELKISPARIALAANSSKFTFQASGGKANYNFSMPGAKGAISTDAVTGKFAYTPSADEENLTLTVTDAAGQTATATLIVYKPLMITPDPLSLKVGQVLSNINITGGIKNPAGEPPYTLTLDTTEFGQFSGANPYTFTATNKAGIAKLTITDNPEFGASNIDKDITVIADLPKSLQLSGVDTMKAGECQPYAITLIDQFGNIANANNKQYNFNLSVTLKTPTGESVATNGAFFVDDACSMAGTSTFIDSVSTARTVYYKSARAGVVTLTATHSNAAAVGANLAAAQKDVTVTVNTPSKLVFITQPPAVTEMAEIMQPNIKVGITDLAGNILTTNEGQSIKIQIESNPGQAELYGKTKFKLLNGQVEYSDLSLNQFGVGFTLKAVLVGQSQIQPAISNAFNIQATARVAAAPSLVPSDGVAYTTIVVYPREGNGTPVSMIGKTVQITASTNDVVFDYTGGVVSCTVSGGLPCAVAIPAGYGSYIAKVRSSKAGTNAQFNAVVKNGSTDYLALPKVANVTFDSNQFITLETMFDARNVNGCNAWYGCQSISINGVKQASGTTTYDSTYNGRNFYFKNIINYQPGTWCNINSDFKLGNISNWGHVYVLGSQDNTRVQISGNVKSLSVDSSTIIPKGDSTASTMKVPGCIGKTCTAPYSFSTMLESATTPVYGDLRNPNAQFYSSIVNGTAYFDANTPLNIDSEGFCSFANNTTVSANASVNLKCNGLITWNNATIQSTISGRSGRLAINNKADASSFVGMIQYPVAASQIQGLDAGARAGNGGDGGGTIYVSAKDRKNGTLFISSKSVPMIKGYSTYLPAIQKAKITAISGNKLTLQFSANQDGLSGAQLADGYQDYFKNTQIVNYANPDDEEAIATITTNDLTSITVNDADAFSVGQDIQTIYLFDSVDVINNGVLKTKAFLKAKYSLVGCNGVSCNSGSSTDSGFINIDKYNARGVLTKVNNVVDHLRLGQGVFYLPDFNQLNHQLYGNVTVYVDNVTQDFDFSLSDLVKLNVMNRVIVNASASINSSSQLIANNVYVKKDLTINAPDYTIPSSSQIVQNGLLANSPTLQIKVDGDVYLKAGYIMGRGNAEMPTIFDFQNSPRKNAVGNLSYAGLGALSSAASCTGNTDCLAGSNINDRRDPLPSFDSFKNPKYPGYKSNGVWMNIAGNLNLTNGYLITNSTIWLSDSLKNDNGTAGSAINVLAKSFSGTGSGQIQVRSQTGGRISLRSTGTKSDFTGDFNLDPMNYTKLKSKIINTGSIPFYGNSNILTDLSVYTKFNSQVIDGDRAIKSDWTNYYSYVASPGAGTTYMSASDMSDGMLIVDNKNMPQAVHSGVTELPAFDKYFYTVKSIDSVNKLITLDAPLPISYTNTLIDYTIRTMDSGNNWRSAPIKIVSNSDDKLTVENLTNIVVGDKITVYHKLNFIDAAGGSIIKTNGYLEVTNTFGGNIKGSINSDGAYLMMQNQMVNSTSVISNLNSLIDANNDLELKTTGAIVVDRIQTKNLNIIGNRFIETLDFVFPVISRSTNYLFVRDQIIADTMNIQDSIVSARDVQVAKDLNISTTATNALVSYGAQLRGINSRILSATVPANLKLTVGGNLKVSAQTSINASLSGSAGVCTSANGGDSGYFGSNVSIKASARYSQLDGQICGNGLLSIQVGNNLQNDGFISSYSSNWNSEYSAGGNISLNITNNYLGTGKIIANGKTVGSIMTAGGHIVVKAKTVSQFPDTKAKFDDLVLNFQAYGDSAVINNCASPQSSAGAGTVLIQTADYPHGYLFVTNNHNQTLTGTSKGKTLGNGFICAESGLTALHGFEATVASVVGDVVTLTTNLPNINSNYYTGIKIRNMSQRLMLADWTKDPIAEIQQSSSNKLTLAAGQGNLFKANDVIRVIHIFDAINVGGSGVVYPNGTSDLYVKNGFLGNTTGSVNSDGLIMFNQSNVGGALNQVNNGIEKVVLKSGIFNLANLNFKNAVIEGASLVSRNKLSLDTAGVMKSGIIMAPEIQISKAFQLESGSVYTSAISSDSDLTLGNSLTTTPLLIANGYWGKLFSNEVKLKVTGNLNLASNLTIYAMGNPAASGYPLISETWAGQSHGGQGGKYYNTSTLYTYTGANPNALAAPSYGNYREPLLAGGGTGVFSAEATGDCTIDQARVDASYIFNGSSTSTNYLAGGNSTSGGSILFKCQTYQMTGRSGGDNFTASGMMGAYVQAYSYDSTGYHYFTVYHGAGGGGRIAIQITGDSTKLKFRDLAANPFQQITATNLKFDSTLMTAVSKMLNASGGYAGTYYNIPNSGGAGTIYLQTSDYPNGVLMIDNRSIPYSAAYSGLTQMPGPSAVNGQLISQVTGDAGIGYTVNVVSNGASNFWSPFSNTQMTNKLNGYGVRFFDPSITGADDPQFSPIQKITGNTGAALNVPGGSPQVGLEYRMTHKLNALIVKGSAQVDFNASDLWIDSTTCDALSVQTGSAITKMNTIRMPAGCASSTDLSRVTRLKNY